jgi:lysine 2,3-aminomutase
MQPTPAKSAPKYLTRLNQIEQLPASEMNILQPVAERFAFRTNDYYQSLINWADPHDPIRRIIMPDVAELDEFGKWDASDEASYSPVRGLEHKYFDTALMLVNNVCGAYCRFCFRKRLFTDDNDEVINDVTEAVDYVRHHPEISNVLLTGGDPLVLSTGKLERVLRQLKDITHVHIVRIGSKMLAFNPYRILNDSSLPELFSSFIKQEKRIYLMAHFNHARELTPAALEAARQLQNAGVTIVNQSPLIRGVNDDPGVLANLFERLSFNGIIPYYLFMCRPTIGNKEFRVPVEESFEIFQDARRSVSGLAKHARLCMSHKTGKIELLAVVEGQSIFRYHRAADYADIGRIMIFPSNPEAYWFDDYLRIQRRACA